MLFIDQQLLDASSVLAGWYAEDKRLFAFAAIHLGTEPFQATLIRLPACTFQIDVDPASAGAMLISTGGSVVTVSEWNAAIGIDVRRCPAGTRIRVTFADGMIVVADYNCAADVRELAAGSG